MLEHLKHIEWANMIPFMLAAGSSQPRMNAARLLETLIIGGLVAGLTVWSTQNVIQNEIAHIQRESVVASTDMRELKQAVVALEFKVIAMDVRQTERYRSYLSGQMAKGPGK